MASGKKSFLLYCDLIHTVSKLPDDKAGELFKHILEYVNDKNPESDDLILNLAFEPIKQALKRDLVKYETIRERNIANIGKRWNKNDTKNTTGKTGIPKIPNDTVSVSVSDIDIKIPFVHFWEKYPRKEAKKDAEKAWNKIPEKEKSIAVESLGKWFIGKDPKYYPLPATWLNGKRWEDQSNGRVSLTEIAFLP